MSQQTAYAGGLTGKSALARRRGRRINDKKINGANEFAPFFMSGFCSKWGFSTPSTCVVFFVQLQFPQRATSATDH
jgi:hypothetical protein